MANSIFTRDDADRASLRRVEQKWVAMGHPANQAALEQLKALINVEGALKIITNVPDERGNHLDTRNPKYWVAHNAVRLEGPDHNGNVWAFSREGDYCGGHALALLRRLTQYGLTSLDQEFPYQIDELVVPEPLTKE